MFNAASVTSVRWLFEQNFDKLKNRKKRNGKNLNPLPLVWYSSDTVPPLRGCGCYYYWALRIVFGRKLQLLWIIFYSVVAIRNVEIWLHSSKSNRKTENKRHNNRYIRFNFKCQIAIAEIRFLSIYFSEFGRFGRFILMAKSIFKIEYNLLNAIHETMPYVVSLMRHRLCTQQNAHLNNSTTNGMFVCCFGNWFKCTFNSIKYWIYLLKSNPSHCMSQSVKYRQIICLQNILVDCTHTEVEERACYDNLQMEKIHNWTCICF